MNTIVILFICLSMMLPSDHGVDEQIIDSKAVLIINGQKLTAPFTVLLKESVITVNGIDYPLNERIIAEYSPFPNKVKPPLEDRNIVDWLMKTAVMMTNEHLAAGDKDEIIWSDIEKFFEENSDGVIVKITGDKGSYRIKYREIGLGVGLTLQKDYISFRHTTKHEKIKSQYDELCRMLLKSVLVENTEGFIKASNNKQKVK